MGKTNRKDSARKLLRLQQLQTQLAARRKREAKKKNTTSNAFVTSTVGREAPDHSAFLNPHLAAGNRPTPTGFYGAANDFYSFTNFVQRQGANLSESSPNVASIMKHVPMFPYSSQSKPTMEEAVNWVSQITDTAASAQLNLQGTERFTIVFSLTTKLQGHARTWLNSLLNDLFVSDTVQYIPCWDVFRSEFLLEFAPGIRQKDMKEHLENVFHANPRNKTHSTHTCFVDVEDFCSYFFKCVDAAPELNRKSAARIFFRNLHVQVQQSMIQRAARNGFPTNLEDWSLKHLETLARSVWADEYKFTGSWGQSVYEMQKDYYFGSQPSSTLSQVQKGQKRAFSTRDRPSTASIPSPLFRSVKQVVKDDNVIAKRWALRVCLLCGGQHTKKDCPNYVRGNSTRENFPKRAALASRNN